MLAECGRRHPYGDKKGPRPRATNNQPRADAKNDRDRSDFPRSLHPWLQLLAMEVLHVWPAL